MHNENLEKIYENILILEVRNEIVDDIKNSIEGTQRPFENIFKGKTRIILPLLGVSTYKEMLEEFKNIPGYKAFDPFKKEIVRTVKLKNGDEKETRISVGKAIANLKINPEHKKKLLNWYGLYQSNIEHLHQGSTYSVILSRDPIDVVKMSDVGGWRSCHAPGEGYFKCAIQEAKSGGAVAFLVKNDSLDQLKEMNIDVDNAEIFTDKDRDVKGIKGVSRIRVRRYINKNDNTDLALPELRVYGSRISGFYETIKTFLEQSQHLNVDSILKDYNTSSIVRKGGTYTDSSDSDIFNTFFNVDSFYRSLEHDEKDIDSEDSGSNANRADQFEEELRDYQRRFGSNYKHAFTSYNVEESDDYVYYTADGGLIIDVGDLDIDERFLNLELSDEYDLRKMRSWNPNSPNRWERELPYTFKSLENVEQFAPKMKTFFETFEQLDKTNFAKWEMVGFYAHTNNNKIILSTRVGEDYQEDTDEFRSFCENMHDFDDKYEDIRHAFISALRKAGLITNGHDDGFNDSDSDSLDRFYNSLKNFEPISEDNDENVLEFSSKVFAQVCNFDEKRLSQISLLIKEFYKIANLFISMELYKNHNQHIQNSKKVNQLSFSKFFESFTFQQHSFDLQFISKANHGFGTSKTCDVAMTLKVDQETKTGVDVISFIDDNYENIINLLRLKIARALKISGDYEKRLEKVYGKLLDSLDH